MQYGQLPCDYGTMEQQEYLRPLLKLISEDAGLSTSVAISFVVIPAIRRKNNNTKNKMYLNSYDLSDWLPNAFMTYKSLVSEG
jgi:hypothetical protein